MKYFFVFILLKITKVDLPKSLYLLVGMLGGHLWWLAFFLFYSEYVHLSKKIKETQFKNQHYTSEALWINSTFLHEFSVRGSNECCGTNAILKIIDSMANVFISKQNLSNSWTRISSLRCMTSRWLGQYLAKKLQYVSSSEYLDAGWYIIYLNYNLTAFFRLLCVFLLECWISKRTKTIFHLCPYTVEGWYENKYKIYWQRQGMFLRKKTAQTRRHLIETLRIN